MWSDAIIIRARQRGNALSGELRGKKAVESSDAIQIQAPNGRDQDPCAERPHSTSSCELRVEKAAYSDQVEVKTSVFMKIIHLNSVNIIIDLL